MKLNALELDRMLPLFMREDNTFQGICYALEGEIKQLYEQTNLIKLYRNIDNLPEEVLDELAWQFNSIEYNKSYSMNIKRELIKNCLSTHHKRGTVASVEEIATKIFGNATVTEWFEYGGEPYHFKVFTANVSTSDEMIIEFSRVIKQTQNIRSHLEEVIAETIDSMDVFYGGVVCVTDDITLTTYDIKEFGITGVELCITDGKLSYNLISVQEQNLIFRDSTNGKCYAVMRDGKSEQLVLEVGAYDNPTDSLTLTDAETNINYKVFVNNGALYYEKIV